MKIPGAIICPESLLPEARELACALNDEAGGRDTFSLAPLRQTPDGRRWSVASGSFSPAFLASFGQPLQPRDWPFDMALATAAQAKLQPVTPLPDGTWPPLASDKISYVIGLEGTAVLAIWGLDWPAE